MKSEEFCAQLLAEVLINTGADITVDSGGNSREIIRDMVEMWCCEALKDIWDIVNDPSLEDEDRFHRIRQIISIFEILGPGNSQVELD